MRQGNIKSFALGGVFGSLLALTGISLYWAGNNYAGPLRGLAVKSITKKYNVSERQNEIIFYGASNFRLWETLEKDIPAYKVQNHGFGGCDDQGLIDYADKLLYPYRPKIIVFQTGSNDYVSAPGSDDEKVRFCINRKKEMFTLFHKRLPEAQMIVVSGLLLSGRAEYMNITSEVNRQLKKLCEETDYLTFVDSDTLTLHDGKADPNMFIDDGIHLTPAARIIWANDYIVPAIKTVVEAMGETAYSLEK